MPFGSWTHFRLGFRFRHGGGFLIGGRGVFGVGGACRCTVRRCYALLFAQAWEGAKVQPALAPGTLGKKYEKMREVLKKRTQCAYMKVTSLYR